MDFAITKEQKLVCEEVRDFAQRELNVDVAARDRQQTFSRQLWRKCGEAGVLAFPIPVEYGGRGLDFSTTALAFEALGNACHDGGLVFSIGAHLFSCALAIAKHGTDAQKRRYLPGLCDGTLIGGNASSEPEAGSDIFSMTTGAQRDGETHQITGKKTFISNGPVADVLLVSAVTDERKRALGGISTFVLEKGAAGVTVGSNVEKMGLRTSPLGDVMFDKVVAPADTILGQLGGGATIFAQSMEWERIGLFAAHVGTIARLLETAVARARQRRQFGQSIGKFQAVSHRIARMKVQLEAARLLVYRAAWLVDQNQNVSLEAAMAKLFVSECFVHSALDTVQTLGGYGYLTHYEVERVLRDAVASTIYSGTSDVQSNIIARWLAM